MGTEDGLGFDALNDAESVIWVNDLVTNLECHMSPTEVRWLGYARQQQCLEVYRIIEDPATGSARKWGFLHSFDCRRDRRMRSDHRSAVETAAPRTV